MTGPNVLSLIRILLAPCVGAAILWGRPWHTMVLLGTALASDFFDGWWARRAGLSSDLGRILDPLADKILVASTLVALAIAGRVPYELAVLVVLRDLLLMAFGWIRMRSGRSVPAAELPGKIGFGVLGGYLVGEVVGIPWPTWIPALVGVLYVVTGLGYAKRIPGLRVARAAKGER